VNPETITGDANGNKFIGGSGDDTIDGAGGNDTITGGGGSDLLTGGTGSNTFHYAGASEGVDTITDFKTGGAGDVLDIKDLLTGFGGAGGSDPNDFVQLTVASGNTTVSVDANGTVGGSSFIDLATLSGVDVGTSTAADLVTDGNLIVS
jgi:Ca2+-binding RTX toxin-like protein